ncbi:glycerol-3-phosphate dehydrogenase/oxidase [Haloglycomyces albus]|uniref:glycerol-3-phosphate dehydrogenase/oxidase n=1 Tax=Haloglycomyces albus TaxID=526067 RepID=UPI00046CAF84|nr:glycerol-3-phosphate dehydrogenase/oxidase [Haloglycomyces albus]
MRILPSWTRSHAAQLSPQRRDFELVRATSEEFDLVIVGGGVTGAGCAVDAASRGLNVALIEARDFGSGTSSRSSKLIHGGLRYLEQLDVALVHEALTERGLLTSRIAPHLVHALPFLLPVKSQAQRLYYGAGLFAYDFLASANRWGRGVPHHQHFGKAATQRLFPDLNDKYVGSIGYYDAQTDDARLVSTLARTAAGLGACVLSSVEALGLERGPDGISGVKAYDVESGERMTLKTTRVVSAAGVWSDEVTGLAHGRSGINVEASKGVHLVLPREAIQGDTAIIDRTPWSVLFIIPWDRHWLIGTTDTSWNLNLAHPAASASDVAYLLEQASETLGKRIDISAVEGVYAGLRPLLKGESDDTSRLSRTHAVVEPERGFVVVAGGKLTTYRVMARDTIDRVTRDLPYVQPSRTEYLPLLGADGWEYYLAHTAAVAKRYRQSEDVVSRLLHRYGNLAVQILELMRQQPQLARPLAGDEQYLRAEVVYAARCEGALHLEDVLARRLRVSIETTDRGVKAAEDTAGLMATVLGWNETTQDNEVACYLDRVAAEKRSQQQPDDNAAENARMAACEIRRVLELSTSR